MTISRDFAKQKHCLLNQLIDGAWIDLSIQRVQDGTVFVTFTSPGIWGQMQFPEGEPFTVIETTADLRGASVQALRAICNAMGDIEDNPIGFFSDPVDYLHSTIAGLRQVSVTQEETKPE